ncbi:MAG: hypothetical protein K8U03_05960 [Planctomycetia bacterium]|nr:hypothetical protein [Planctomycetia bacterium]
MAARVKHGARRDLTSGLLPAGCEHIAREGRKLRNLLETAVLNLRNSIGPREQALIQSAHRHETIYRLLLHFLTTQADLTTDQKLTIMRDMRSSITARDKPIADLRIEDDGKTLDGLVYDKEKAKANG